jgi:1-acyl-sn-glycerol-3-phosphate acyltransferase
MLRSVVYAVAFYLCTALYVILGFWLLLAPRAWAMEGLRLHGLTCLWLLKVICGTHLEIRGRDRIPPGACLVVSKHQSAWDTFALIPIFKDPAIVTKDELKWIPVYGWFILKFEHIRVQRARAAAALRQMVLDAKVCAAQGRQILIFPEGTRVLPGAAPDYKPGYLALYSGLDLPCVPLALNSGLFWPRRSLMRYPGTIVVEILEPVPPGLSRAEARARVEDAIEAASNRLIAEANSRAPDMALQEAATQ